MAPGSQWQLYTYGEMVRPGHVVGLADKGLTPSFVRTGVLSSMPLMTHHRKARSSTAQRAKDYADENLLAVPSSTIVTAVPGFWLIALRNHVGVGAGTGPTFLPEDERRQRPGECLAGLRLQHLVVIHLWDVDWCEVVWRVKWLQGPESCLRPR
ncbi:hypothetical protein BJV77DRAFT_1149157 [Russula vinacea]|nr:hypothetical protein BJV77DRAFT_1149157 [Russula vinacea]